DRGVYLARDDRRAGRDDRLRLSQDRGGRPTMRRRFYYAAAQAGFRAYHHLAFGFRVEGIENVPLDGPCLLAANHKSYLDPLAAGSPLPREIHYFAKRELFRIPILGPMIRAVGGIPVDRHSFDRQAIHR